MTEKTGMFARMMASTGLGAPKPMGSATAGAPAGTTVAPAPDSATDASDGLTETQVEPMLVAAKAEGHAEGVTAGATAERERTSAVFASEAGQANMPMAAWMLESSPNASADAIIGKLATMPKATVATTAAPAPAATVTTPLASTPKPDLGGGTAANDGNADGGTSQADVDSSWDTAITDIAQGGGFGAQVRLPGAIAAKVQPARNRTGN